MSCRRNWTRDRRGIYFKQAAYGVPVRMALLKFLFDRRESQSRRARRRKRSLQKPGEAGTAVSQSQLRDLKEAGSTQRRFELFAGGPGGALILGCAYCDHRFKVQLVGDVKSKRYCAYDIRSPARLTAGWKNNSWRSSIRSRKPKSSATSR